MNKQFYLKFKGEQKWLGFTSIYEWRDLKDLLSYNRMTPEEKSQCDEFLQHALQKFLQKDNTLITTEIKKTTIISKSFVFDYLPEKQIEDMISFFTLREHLYEIGRKYSQEPEARNENVYFIKKLKELQSKLSDFEVVEKSAEADFVCKKAYAVFAECDGQSGYQDKSGSLGPISSAKIFDSDKAAQRAGNCGGLDFEVMEVEISLKKRTNINPNFENKEMQTALSYLEREKINNLLNEVGEDKIEQMIAQRKKHKI